MNQIRLIRGSTMNIHMFVTIALVIGCSAGCNAAPQARIPPYTWGFINATDGDLYDVGIKYPLSDGTAYDKSIALVGVHPLDKDILEGKLIDDPGYAPIPDHVTVYWRTHPDGPVEQQEVAVASNVPFLYTGIVFLRISPRGVEAILPEPAPGAANAWKWQVVNQSSGGQFIEPTITFAAKKGTTDWDPKDGEVLAPIPERARVFWKSDPTGPWIEQEFPVRVKVPEVGSFSGTIWLRLLDDGLKLQPISNSENPRRVALQLYLRPGDDVLPTFTNNGEIDARGLYHCDDLQLRTAIPNGWSVKPILGDPNFQKTGFSLYPPDAQYDGPVQSVDVWVVFPVPQHEDTLDQVKLEIPHYTVNLDGTPIPQVETLDATIGSEAGFVLRSEQPGVNPDRIGEITAACFHNGLLYYIRLGYSARHYQAYRAAFDLILSSLKFDPMTATTPRAATRPAGPAPHYSWGFQNTSAHELVNVEMRYPFQEGYYGIKPGHIQPSTSNAQGNPSGPVDHFGIYPIPNKITAYWSPVPNGPVKQQEIDLTGKIPDPAHFGGTIWLKFTDDAAEVVVKP
jgi:hypothetical protein